MAELIMMQGLPGSGKSTLAAELATKDSSYVVVNKDDIRAELTSKGWQWSQEAEKRDVIPLRDSKIEAALAAGMSAISSDTNFGRDHKKALSAIAHKHGATFRTWRVDVPVVECVRRNAARSVGQVPEAVIWKMYNQFIQADPERWPLSAQAQVEYNLFEPTAKGKPCIICDLDGTLALNTTGRNPYDASTSDQDSLNLSVWAVIDKMSKAGWQIIYCSGREDKDREPTERFLHKYGCPIGPLFMRATGDHRKDYIVKLEIFNREIREKYNPLFVLDDRDQVVEMWRKLGLACWQVAPGNF